MRDDGGFVYMAVAVVVGDDDDDGFAAVVNDLQCFLKLYKIHVVGTVSVGVVN